MLFNFLIGIKFKISAQINLMDTSFKIKPFSLVVAACRKGGIGLKGGFPWPMIKKDLAHFSRVTKCTNLSLDSAEIAKQFAFY
jgi:hypothetical protein